MTRSRSIPRYIENQIRLDLKDKMVFIGGPRQVGKTQLSLHVAGGTQGESNPAYFNWDSPKARRAILNEELPFDTQPIIILDEIHKYLRWRNLVKGLYDTHRSNNSFLVTGSARLDYYRRGGDSLQGRYHYFRLHPFSLKELAPGKASPDLVQQLLKFGGFPEPLIKSDEVFWRRWQTERTHRVLREDLRDLERVREISLIELLVDLLPDRVGSPLSIQNLRESLEVSHESVVRWIEILERLYLCFRILPFGSPRIRAVKKEQKLYFWDWSLVTQEGPRFENMVACQLLKYCHFLEDTRGDRMELRYLRDTDRREVDFVVIQNRKPIFAVECKTSDESVDRSLHYFRERTAISEFYQVHLKKKDYGSAKNSVRVLPFWTFCNDLNMP